MAASIDDGARAMLPAVKTPGHLVVNTAALHAIAPAAAGDDVVAGIALGAVLPDVPIMALYAWAKLVRRIDDDERIWRELYPTPWFLALVHGLHSLPLSLLIGALGFAIASPFVAWAGASMLLHAAADFPIHGEDAHRHLWPFSDARFVSPLSYWDVRRHARVVAAFECALVVGCAGALAITATSSTGITALCLAIAAGYPVHYVVVFGGRRT
jgi:hypothetical protein